MAARRISLARTRAERSAHGPADGPAPGAGEGGPVRSLEDALRAPGRNIIAEIKRRSPSAGVIRQGLEPRTIAAAYAAAGAAALSVLTEPEFFGGCDADLVEARSTVRLPVLRKDFILDAEGVEESRELGADAILLLAAVLSRRELSDLLGEARRAGIDALVEVHDEAELEVVLEAEAAIVGVNSRDLRDFSVDLRRAEGLARRIPDSVVRVAESGIRDRGDVLRLEAAGYRAFLVGESLLRLADPAAGLRELLA